MANQFLRELQLSNGSVLGGIFDTITASDLPDLSGVYALLAGANVFTRAPQTITVDDAGHVGLVVTAAAGQSANALTVQNSSSQTLFGINGSGGTVDTIYSTFTSDIFAAVTLSHLLSSGTAAAGMGTSVIFRCTTGTNQPRTQGSIATSWIDAATATNKGRITLNAYSGSVAREGIRVDASASAALLGFFATSAVAQQSGNILTALENYGLVTSPTLPAGTGSVTSVSGSGGTTGLTLTGGPITGSGTLTLGGTLVVADGGTGLATLTAHSLYVGNGTSAPTALGAATNGQLPIGSTGADPVLAALTGTANQITVTPGAGSITLSIPSSPVLPGTTRSDAHYGTITTDTPGSTITFDMSVSNLHSVTLGAGSGAGNSTLAASNDNVGQTFMLMLKQDGTGGRTVSWFSGILWPGGTVPTLTTAINKTDVFSFVKLGAGSYLGFTVGLNL